MQTDGQTDMTKLIVALRYFAKAPKNHTNERPFLKTDCSPVITSTLIQCANAQTVLGCIRRNAIQFSVPRTDSCHCSTGLYEHDVPIHEDSTMTVSRKRSQTADHGNLYGQTFVTQGNEK